MFRDRLKLQVQKNLKKISNCDKELKAGFQEHTIESAMSKEADLKLYKSCYEFCNAILLLFISILISISKIIKED